MKYLYLPILFTLALGYSKYFEYSRKTPEVSKIQNIQNKSREPASVKDEKETLNLIKWFKKI